MRSATSLAPKLLRAALVALGLGLITIGAGPSHGANGDVELTRPQARELAGYALENRQPELALRLANGLLQADPKDPYANYIAAVSNVRLEQPREGRKAAARAYRYSKSDSDRLQVATLAARIAISEERPTLAQFWLRRASLYTTSAEDEARLARDYRMLRQRNPWAFGVRTELRPSDNVNNGPDGELMIINGIPTTISGSTRALSGTIGSVDANASYRLSHGQSHLTTLGGRLYVRRIALSDSAKAQAPGASGSDYGATYGELSLRHAFSVGPEGRGDTASATFTLGDSWYGGEHSFGQGQVTLEREWRLARNRSVELTLLAADRFDAPNPSNDARILGVGASYSHKLGNGDRFSLSLFLRDVDAEFSNGTYQSTSFRASYGFARKFGPAKVTAGLSLGRSDYPLVQLNTGYLGSFNGPRDDRSVYGDLTFFFSDYDYAGFAPTLRLRAGHNSSNLEIYSSREMSVSVGIQSKF